MAYRLPTSSLVLPNSFEKIKFPVNRISDNATFNSKITLLNENFDSLLDFATIVDNNLPNSHDGIYNFDDTTWSTPPTTPSPPAHGYKHIEVVEKTTGEYLFICVKSTQIDFYTSDVSGSLTQLVNQINYTQIKDRGSQKFKNISFVKYNNEKLYVYDSTWDAMMVYNIIALITDDAALSQIKFLKHNFKIKDLIALDFKSDIYSISDTHIIRYNSDLNIKESFVLDTTSPIDIIASNLLYVLYDSKFVTYSYAGVKLSEYTFNKFGTETTLRFNLSEVDDDVIYIMTDSYIYKYTTVGVIVGWFNIGSTLNGSSFVDFFVKDASSNDDIFALDDTKLHFLKDKTSTVLLYDANNMSDKVSLTNLKIKDLELEQDFVYNTILQKLLFNNILLYNSLVLKGAVVTDANGVLVYSHKENLVNTEVIETSTILYGQNEVFSFQTFNRAFKEIYDIQTKILNLLRFDITENSTNTLII